MFSKRLVREGSVAGMVSLRFPAKMSRGVDISATEAHMPLVGVYGGTPAAMTMIMAVMITIMLISFTARLHSERCSACCAAPSASVHDAGQACSHATRARSSGVMHTNSIKFYHALETDVRSHDQCCLLKLYG